MKVENIRHSSTLFYQIRIANFSALYFSITGLGLSLIAYEKDFYVMTGINASPRDKLIVSILMWAAFGFTIAHAVALVMRHLIYFRWMQLKQLITKEDTLSSTGYWKSIMGDLVVQCIIPYPFLNEMYYYEHNGRFGPQEVRYKVNHVLLAIMIFSRVYQLLLSTLLLSYWSAPRAQRIW